MRYAAVLSLTLSAALIPLACSSSSTSAVPNANEKIEEAAKAKRDEFARDMQKLLEELDAKYKALEQRAGEAKGDAKRDLDEKVKAAKTKRDAVAKKLDNLKEASHDRWLKVLFEDLKKDLE